MKLQDWANVSFILQGVFIPISLLFVLLQLRKQTQLTRAGLGAVPVAAQRCQSFQRPQRS